MNEPSPATVGSAGELVVAAQLMMDGWHVYRCLSPNGPFDLIAFRDGVTRRIEVRTGRYSDSGRLDFNDERDVYATEFGVWVVDGNKVEFVPCGPVECVELTKREREDAVIAKLVSREMELSGEVAESDLMLEWQSKELKRLRGEVARLERKLQTATAKVSGRSKLSEKHRRMIANRKADRDRVRSELRESGWVPPLADADGVSTS